MHKHTRGKHLVLLKDRNESTLRHHAGNKDGWVAGTWLYILFFISAANGFIGVSNCMGVSHDKSNMIVFTKAMIKSEYSPRQWFNRNAL